MAWFALWRGTLSQVTVLKGPRLARSPQLPCLHGIIYDTFTLAQKLSKVLLFQVKIMAAGFSTGSVEKGFFELMRTWL